MPQLRFRAAAFALAALALLGGCRDASGPAPEPVPDPNEGTMAFTFSGDTGGTFLARGVPPQGPPYAERYTRGFVDPNDGNTYLIGYQGPGAGERLVLVLVDVTGPGTVVSCGAVQPLPPGHPPCFFSTLFLDYDPSGPPTSNIYLTHTGTLQVTELGERLSGTFSAEVRKRTGEVVTISGGSFDFPAPAFPSGG